MAVPDCNDSHLHQQMFIFARTPIKAEDDLLSAARPHAFKLVFSNFNIDVHYINDNNVYLEKAPTNALSLLTGSFTQMGVVHDSVLTIF